MDRIEISIVIPTIGRPNLYPLLEKLKNQVIENVYEVVLVSQNDLETYRINDPRIKVFPQKPARGYAFYRNWGVGKASGDIIVFIDDDELPLDDHWLQNLTQPIVSGNADVTTAGYRIELGNGYLNDCVSLLGFPGGGAAGYLTIWPLDKNNRPVHLCGGNMAIRKRLFQNISLPETLVYGCEDVYLSNLVRRNKISAAYCSEATVWHEPRKGFLNFISLNIRRGRSITQLLRTGCHIDQELMIRLKSSWRIIMGVGLSHYLPGVIFSMMNQYFWQTWGLVKERFSLME
ncbi:MAG: glycosyltransferase family 2 protein [Candidatus Cloacimonetes bacterium]|nr:glycosyltransferase family 2 protein [Candidatus Cloacimonadota bacterium]